MIEEPDPALPDVDAKGRRLGAERSQVRDPVFPILTADQPIRPIGLRLIAGHWQNVRAVLS